MTTTVNVDELRNKVKAVYREVAEDPHREFHFEVGRGLAERLGYRTELLDRIAPESVDSFAGVGCPFDAADIGEGESVLDLGSGSGMDSSTAALLVGRQGRVTGLDMTDEQLAKAARAASQAGLSNVTFEKGFIEELPVPSGTIDVVISNGVINLAADKGQVFREIARVLRSGGRMAISDIVSERQLTEKIVCDASLWAACIGGAAQEDDYVAAIEASGLRVVAVVENRSYGFLSASAKNATRDFGVKSVSIRAEKPE